MIPPPPLLHVSVRVSDVEGAAKFYDQALGGDWAITTTPSARARTLIDGQVLLLILPADAEPPEYDDPTAKGITPRLDIQTYDVGAALDRFVRAGGKELFRSGDPPSYGQVEDPYGHLWAFSVPVPDTDEPVD